MGGDKIICLPPKAAFYSILYCMHGQRDEKGIMSTPKRKKHHVAEGSRIRTEGTWGAGNDGESSCPCDFSTSGVALNTREGCAVELEQAPLGCR